MSGSGGGSPGGSPRPKTNLTDKQISDKVLAVFDDFCKKSKKVCALCDKKLGKPSREEMAEISGGIWCSWVGFRHPKYKSKSYRLCGHCFAATRSDKGDGEKHISSDDE